MVFYWLLLYKVFSLLVELGFLILFVQGRVLLYIFVLNVFVLNADLVVLPLPSLSFTVTIHAYCLNIVEKFGFCFLHLFKLKSIFSFLQNPIPIHS